MTESDIGKDRLGPLGDDFYEMLMAAHDDLSFEESARLNARLVLVLANMVGGWDLVKQAIEAAGDCSENSADARRHS